MIWRENSKIDFYLDGIENKVTETKFFSKKVAAMLLFHI